MGNTTMEFDAEIEKIMKIYEGSTVDENPPLNADKPRVYVHFDKDFLTTVRSNKVRTHQLQILRASITENDEMYEKFGPQKITEITQTLELGSICFVDREMHNLGLYGATWIDNCHMTDDFKQRYVQRMTYLSMLFETELCNNETSFTLKRILHGSLDFHEIAGMSHVELEPERFKHEFIDNRSKMTTTTMYQCSRCHKRKCWTYKHTTKSADEGATVRVVCTVCGNSWNT
ncbi:MAG: hypothetical protein CMK92_05060 [Pseudomonas sp.]|nr:hypothetical protein [Pseudomonas sp.]